VTQGSRSSNPWAEISERLRRILKLNHYSKIHFTPKFISLTVK